MALKPSSTSARCPARAGRLHRVFHAARDAVAVPAPIVVFEVVSPGQDNQRWDEEKVDEYESVPSILRYVVVESENRSFRAYWRDPGEQAWHREAADTDGPIRVPKFGIDLALDEVFSGIEFD
jgi:Uma2 family endonuclease